MYFNPLPMDYEIADKIPFSMYPISLIARKVKTKHTT